MKILFKKLRDVKNPSFGTNRAAGIDFFVPNDTQTIRLNPHTGYAIPSGIKLCIKNDDLTDPVKNYALIALNKSGVSIKKGLQVGAQLVDIDYTGEIHLHLYNRNDYPIAIEPGEKIVQFVITEVFNPELVEVSDEKELDRDSERGSGMAGSTGTF